MRCQEVVSAWDKSINSWISEVKQYGETMTSEQSHNGRVEYQIDEITYAKVGVTVMVVDRELWTLKLNLWISQIWSLINNFVTVLACAKCLKFITLEENIISVQQLPFCLPLLLVFSSEVLNSGIKSCFDEVAFQDAVCEECFSIRLRCLHL